jgi:hypothetical protein
MGKQVQTLISIKQHNNNNKKKKDSKDTINVVDLFLYSPIFIYAYKYTSTFFLILWVNSKVFIKGIKDISQKGLFKPTHFNQTT